MGKELTPDEQREIDEMLAAAAERVKEFGRRMKEAGARITDPEPTGDDPRR